VLAQKVLAIALTTMNGSIWHWVSIVTWECQIFCAICESGKAQGSIKDIALLEVLAAFGSGKCHNFAIGY